MTLLKFLLCEETEYLNKTKFHSSVLISSLQLHILVLSPAGNLYSHCVLLKVQIKTFPQPWTYRSLFKLSPKPIFYFFMEG